jgi:hypothetical protein
MAQNMDEAWHGLMRAVGLEATPPEKEGKTHISLVGAKGGGDSGAVTAPRDRRGGRGGLARLLTVSNVVRTGANRGAGRRSGRSGGCSTVHGHSSRAGGLKALGCWRAAPRRATARRVH